MLSHLLRITSIPVAICTFWSQIQTPLSLKQKTFFRFLLQFWNVHEICENFWYKFKRHYLLNKRHFLDFYCSSEMCMKFRKFWIESWESYLNYFQNYILRKSSLLKRLKDLASEHHSVNNALTVSKHCWNQQGTTIILFFHEFGIYWIGKSLC